MEILFLHKDIRKFIDRLDDSTYAETFRLIEILAVQEYRITMPHSKKIEKDIYELRVMSKQNVRIFYSFNEGKIFLLHIISKKSQRLHSDDIETARRRLKSLQ